MARATPKRELLDLIVGPLIEMGLDIEIEGPIRAGPAWEYRIRNGDEQMKLAGYPKGEMVEQFHWGSAHAYLMGLLDLANEIGPETVKDILSRRAE